MNDRADAGACKLRDSSQQNSQKSLMNNFGDLYLETDLKSPRPKPKELYFFGAPMLNIK